MAHASNNRTLFRWRRAVRQRFGAIARKAFAFIGRFEPLSEEEKALRHTDVVRFKGDVPIHAGAKNEQHRCIYVKPRPVFETVDNLVVTPDGGAFLDGVFMERYSVERPGLRILLSSPKPERRAPAGIFVSSGCIATFGDWTSGYLSTLANLERIDAPVFMPPLLAGKGYVKDAAVRFGFDIVSIDAPILIEKAKVLRQQRFSRYWQANDIAAMRRFFKAAPPKPEPGSLLYLSRYGEPSEVFNRGYPSLAIEELVKTRGGRVLRTGESRLDDYIAAATSAETVLLDHGSAGYNMIYWRPRRVIEFASDAWWMNAFLMFADAMGVKDYTLIRSDLDGPETVVAKTAAALDAPIEMAS